MGFFKLTACEVLPKVSFSNFVTFYCRILIKKRRKRSTLPLYFALNFENALLFLFPVQKYYSTLSKLQSKQALYVQYFSFKKRE